MTAHLLRTAEEAEGAGVEVGVYYLGNEILLVADFGREIATKQPFG